MTLNFVYNTQEEIPAGFADLYSEKNGKWELSGVTGIKTQADVDRVQNSLTSERTAHKATKDRLRQVTFNGLPIVEMNDDQLRETVEKLDRYDELVASSGKIDDEKVNAIVESRIKAKLAPVERENNQLKDQLKQASGEIDTFKGKDRTRAIHDAVRKARIESKVLDTAEEDVLILAERIFDVSEDGVVTVKDQVGFTPGLTADVWLTEMQSKRPHWWPESKGGGARGGKGGQGGANNPWSKESWNLTEQGKYLREHGSEKATQMAQLAGSKVGATAPLAK